MYERCSFSVSLPALGVSFNIYFNSYNRYTVISHWVLICVFLMTSDVEHFFLVIICHQYIPFCEISHFFAHFLIRSFLLLSFESLLYILDQIPVRYVVCKFFCHYVSCFCILGGVLYRAKVFNLMKASLSGVFLLWDMFLLCCLKILTKRCVQKVCPMFFFSLKIL